MKLSVISIANGLVRVAAEGEVTVRDFRSDGRDPFYVLLGDRWATQKVLVDMAAVSFLDSSAVGWFITCRREFDRSGGMLVLHSVQPRVRQVLDLLRVGRVVPLATDEAAAVKIAAPATASAPLNAAPSPSQAQAPSQPPAEAAGSYDVKPNAAPSKPNKPRRGTKAA